MKTNKTLREGGNVRIDNLLARPLDLRDKSPEFLDELKLYVKNFLIEINYIFRERFGRLLWRTNLLRDNIIFSGSTRALFTEPSEEFLLYKDTLGDLDVFVPKETQENFNELLMYFVDNEIAGVFIDGTIKSEWVEQNHFLISIPSLKVNNLQLDFEFTSFKKTKPTDFALYSHYSSWEDIQAGIKGAFSKKLLDVFIKSIRIENPLVISSVTKRPLRNELDEDGCISPYYLNYDKGFAEKYSLVKSKVYKERYGGNVWERNYDLDYSIDMDKMFKVLIGREPAKDEIVKLFSFLELAKLIKLRDKDLEYIYTEFTKLLFSSEASNCSSLAQALDRRNTKKDIEMKLDVLESLDRLWDTEFTGFNGFSKEEVLELYYEEMRPNELVNED